MVSASAPAAPESSASRCRTGSSGTMPVNEIGSPSTFPARKRKSAGAGSGAATVKLSDADANAIGKKIWQNECGGTVEGLTSWNAGEDFPSLGIGHFIWYVPGRPGPFQESFPPLIAFMKERNVPLPAWLAEADEMFGGAQVRRLSES